MLPRGVEFLHPIWMLITDEDSSEGRILLGLSFNDIKVYYTKYVNNHKHVVTIGERSVDEAVQAGLTPGNKTYS